MKKKISLLGLVVILTLGLAGCGSSTETEYDEAAMEQYADTLIYSFSNMTDDDFAVFEDYTDLQLDLTLLNSGLPVESDVFLEMIESWQSGVEECGTLTDIGDYELDIQNDGAVLKAPVTGTIRNGEIQIAFDEKLNMESLAMTGDYTIGEIAGKAGMNTLIGMGTVFVMLILIAFIISLFKYIPVIQAKFTKKNTEAPKAAAPAAAKPAAPAAPVQTASAQDDKELIAVISAAIAAAEGTPADGFIVRSIKRRKSNKWS